MSNRQRRRLVSSRANRIGRREFLGRAALVGGAVALGPTLLTACGGDDDDNGAGGGGDGGGNGGTRLRVSNWIEYIDEDQQLVRDSADAIGARVEYIEDVNDNNEYFATVLQPALSQGRSANRDGFVVTDWMAARVISLDWVTPLDREAMENAGNLRSGLASPPWDPDRTFSLPWQSGLAGIAYNRAKTGRDLESVEDLFDPAFRGQVTFLTEMRDTVGLMLLAEGVDPGEITSFEQAEGAFARIEQAKTSGQLRAFTGNEYVSDLTTGNIAAAIAWSGDVLQASLENPDIQFVIPVEGGMLWSDNFLIPSTSENVTLASQWIDWFYDPVNAARLTEAVQFISPVDGVAEELRKLGGDAAALADNPLVVPDDETLERVSIFAGLDEQTEEAFDQRFSQIVGA